MNPTNQPKEARPRQRLSLVRKAVILYFILVFLAFLWPIYPLFNKIFPLVLGMPFSLFYLVFLLVLSFLVLLSFHLWEERQGEVD